MANPDGYDFTFTEGNRLWRKTLRDNDGDGVITGNDGVDPNRNYPTKWGYDDEGSSGTTRQRSLPRNLRRSEPETQALDGLMRRIRFEFLVNYHSAAELLLYGVGWQVATPTPDDLVYEALAGDDANPAVAGYDPDIAAELYITNGETTEHAHVAYGTLGFTPEMSTCETASAADPNDEFDPADCDSVFNFPDSEALVQAEFEKNIPFALSVAKSAKDPSNPVSAIGRSVPDFAVDSFDVSYGDPQQVAVTARRDIKDLTLRYSISGGRERRPCQRVARRRTVRRRVQRLLRRVPQHHQGHEPGDTVEVWFTGKKRSHGGHNDDIAAIGAASGQVPSRTEDEGWKASTSPTECSKTVGRSWCWPTRTTRVSIPSTRIQSLRRNMRSNTSTTSPPPASPAPCGTSPAKGCRASSWACSAISSLSIWYLGDNRLTQDPEDEITETSRRRILGDLRSRSGSSTSQWPC